MVGLFFPPFLRNYAFQIRRLGFGCSTRGPERMAAAIMDVDVKKEKTLRGWWRCHCNCFQLGFKRLHHQSI